LDEKLAEVTEILSQRGAGDAYAALRVDSRIKNLGPAFASKFLYFSGFERSPGGQQPLILDRYVAEAVNRFCGTSWGVAGWSTKLYDDYLELAHAWASEWGCKPDVVELSLFIVGKVPRLPFEVLSGRSLPETC